MEKKKRPRQYLVRQIAKRAQFSIGDVVIILNTLNDVLYDLVRQKKEELIRTNAKRIDVINLYGLFDIKIVKIEPHMGYDGLRKEEIYLDETYKIVVTPSKTIKYFLE